MEAMPLCILYKVWIPEPGCPLYPEAKLDTPGGRIRDIEGIMALKSLVLVSVLGLVLLVLVGSQTRRETPAQKFQRQHMDPGNFPRNSATYCNMMMKNRNMIQGSCKSTNTFVHETEPRVKAVCSQTKVPCRNETRTCWKSNSQMRITDCSLKRSSNYPNCAYKTGSGNKQIIIACGGTPYVPVHFDQSV